jgi:ketosteroid isomerase-like protein
VAKAFCSIICFAFLFALTTVSVGQQNSSQNPKVDNPIAQEVVDTSLRFHGAAVKRDMNTIWEIFDENITHFHLDPYRVVGRDYVHKEFADALPQQENLILYMLDPKVQLLADNRVGILTYYIRETWKQEGRAQNITEKVTEVYEKKGGKWVMVHGNYSR